MFVHFIGRKAVIETARVVYDEPEDLQQYQSTGEGEIKLKECSAYGKLGTEVDVRLEDCPAYVEQTEKDLGIRMDAYGGTRSITLDTCPVYEQVT